MKRVYLSDGQIPHVAVKRRRQSERRNQFQVSVMIKVHFKFVSFVLGRFFVPVLWASFLGQFCGSLF